LVRRDTGEKQFVPMEQLKTELTRALANIQSSLFEKAKRKREAATVTARNLSEFKEILTTSQGFIRAMWCGDKACEDKVKEATGTTSRCIPFEQERISDTCVCCEQEAKEMVFWARAY
jgi:prolyl-tRNA synthetase